MIKTTLGEEMFLPTFLEDVDFPIQAFSVGREEMERTMLRRVVQVPREWVEIN